MNIAIILKVNGLLLLLLSLLSLIPLSIAYAFNEALDPWLWTGGCFLGTALTGIAIGFKSDPQRDLGIREGIAITTLFWFSVSLIASIAIYLAVPNTSFMQSWFESMSGITATGSTIFGAHFLDDQQVGTLIRDLPTSILFWRAILQWLGGIGIVVISIALIPLLIGGSGFQLYRAEIPGLHADRLSPRLSTTARILVGLYLVLTCLLTAAIMLCGGSFFDSLCHAMTCIATGGLSTFDNSIEGFNSAAAEWVIIAGMFIGGLNFTLLIQAIRGKPLALWRNSEARCFLYLVIIAWALICSTLALQSNIYDGHPHDLVRDSLFQVVSIGTSTGYGTGYSHHPEAWNAWPHAAILMLIILMFTGACAGSTAGGIKIARILVLFKTMRREMRRYTEPTRVTPILLDGQRLNDRTILQVNAFIFIYLLTLAIGSMLYALLGNSPAVSFAATLTAISNMGPGIQEIGPSTNFRGFNNGSLGLSIFLMLLGRLELLTVLVALYPKNWRK